VIKTLLSPPRRQGEDQITSLCSAKRLCVRGGKNVL